MLSGIRWQSLCSALGICCVNSFLLSVGDCSQDIVHRASNQYPRYFVVYLATFSLSVKVGRLSLFAMSCPGSCNVPVVAVRCCRFRFGLGVDARACCAGGCLRLVSLFSGVRW